MIKRLAKETVVYGLGLVASRFVLFLLLPIYVRLFTKEEYGLLSLITSAGGMLAILVELQIVSGVARSYYEAKGAGRLKSLTGTAVGLYLRTWIGGSALLAAAFALGRPYLGGGVGWSHALPILLAFLPQSLEGLGMTVLRFEGRPGRFALFTLLQVLLTAGLGVGAVTALGMGVEGVLWGNVAARTISAAAVLWAGRDALSIRYERSAAKEILAYSLPVVPAVFGNWALREANLFVLTAAAGLAEVGVFNAALRLSMVVTLVEASFRQAWGPASIKLIEERRNEAAFDRVLSVYLAGMFGACAMLGALGEPLALWLLGDAYRGAGPLVAFLSMGLLWSGATGILASGNVWERKTGWNTLGYFLGAAVNLGALAWAAPRWGVTAGGICYLAGCMVTAWATLATAQRHHALPFRRLPLWTCTILSVGLAWLLARWEDLPWGRADSALLRAGGEVAAGLAATGLVAWVCLRVRAPRPA